VQQYLRECDEVLRHVKDTESTPEDGSSGNETTDSPESRTTFQHPAECVETAKFVGEEMLEKNDYGAWAGVWAKERAEVS
jgi:hypothetical protein